MDKYSVGDRAFWLECWNGHPYFVDRMKNAEPIMVQHCAVSVFGGTQPEKLAEMLKDTADGLFARFLFSWPDPKKFKLNKVAVNTQFAIDALDRLRLLEMVPAIPGAASQPARIPLDEGCEPILELFVQEMEEAQQFASGPLRIAYGKARGFALRLSLNIEMLRWCGEPSGNPPITVSAESFATACYLVSAYFIPMAERVYGDAVLPDDERNAGTLAR